MDYFARSLQTKGFFACHCASINGSLELGIVVARVTGVINCKDIDTGDRWILRSPDNNTGVGFDVTDFELIEVVKNG